MAITLVNVSYGGDGTSPSQGSCHTTGIYLYPGNTNIVSVRYYFEPTGLNPIVGSVTDYAGNSYGLWGRVERGEAWLDTYVAWNCIPHGANEVWVGFRGGCLSTAIMAAQYSGLTPGVIEGVCGATSQWWGCETSNPFTTSAQKRYMFYFCSQRSNLSAAWEWPGNYQWHGAAPDFNTYNYLTAASRITTVGATNEKPFFASGDNYDNLGIFGAFRAALAPLTLTPQAMPVAVKGVAYSAQIGGTGEAPLTYYIGSGEMPPGITMNQYGTFYGTPSGETRAYTQHIGMYDDEGRHVAEYYTITLTATPPTITTTTLPNITNGVYFQVHIEAVNGEPPLTMTLVGGAIPPGTIWRSDGWFYGTPSGPSQAYSFTGRITDADGQFDDQAYTVSVFTTPPTITTTTLPNGTNGIAYSGQQIAVINGEPPMSFAIVAGALPAGLTLSVAGVIAGTPAAPSTVHSFTVRVTDADGQYDDQALTITITTRPPDIVTTTLPVATNGVNYSQQIAVSNGEPPLSIFIIAGALPGGLSVSPAGLIAGIPHDLSAVYSFTLKALDDDGQSDTQAYTLTLITAPPVITDTTLPDVIKHEAYSHQIAVSGGEPTLVFSLTVGVLPEGLTLSANGVIAGTTAVLTEPFAFSVRVVDADGQSDTQDYILNVTARPPVISTTELPTGAVGSFYHAQLETVYGEPPLVFSFYSGELPPGLTLNAGGFIAGTPEGSKLYTFTVQVLDADGQTGYKSLSIEITVQVTAITRKDFTTGEAAIVVKIRFHGRNVDGTPRTYVWSGQQVSEFTEPAEARVVSFGYYDRAVSGFGGDVRVNTCRVMLVDTDYTLRAWLGNSAQYALKNIDCEIEWIAKKHLIVNLSAPDTYTWAKYFRGDVLRYKPEGGRLFSIEINGVGTRQMVTPFPLPKLITDFPSAPVSTHLLYAPFVLGRKSDEGSARPAPMISPENASGSLIGPMSSIYLPRPDMPGGDYTGYARRYGTVPTGLVMTKNPDPQGDFTDHDNYRFYGMVTFKPASGGGESDPDIFLPRNCVTFDEIDEVGASITITCDNMGAGTYRFHLGADSNGKIYWTQRITTSSPTARFWRWNGLLGHGDNIDTITPGADFIGPAWPVFYKIIALLSSGETAPSIMQWAWLDTDWRRPRVVWRGVTDALSGLPAAYAYTVVRGQVNSHPNDAREPETKFNPQRQWTVNVQSTIVDPDKHWVDLFPTHYWKLNTISGTTVVDYGASPSNGTLSGTPLLRQSMGNGRTGMRFVQDAAVYDAVVTLGASTVAAGPSFTIMCWMRPDHSRAGGGMGVAMLYDQATSTGIGYYPAGGSIYWSDNGTLLHATAGILKEAKLYHIAFTAVSGVGQFYVNGQPAGVVTGVGGAAFKPSIVAWGVRGFWSDMFYSASTALDQSQILAAIRAHDAKNVIGLDETMLPYAPTGFWKLDDINDTILDYSGNARHATLTALGTGERSVDMGHQRRGMRYAGNYITLPALPSSTATWTIAFSIIPTATADGHLPLFGGSGAGIYYAAPNQDVFYYFAGTYTWASVTLPLNVLTHLAVVASGGMVTWYVNGIPKGSGATSTVWTPINIGAGSTWKGKLRDVFYRAGVAMTQAQIIDMMMPSYVFEDDFTDVEGDSGKALTVLPAPSGRLPVVPVGGAYRDNLGIASDWQLFLISYGWESGDIIEGIFQNGVRIPASHFNAGGEIAAPGFGAFSSLFSTTAVVVNTRRYWGIYMRATFASDALSGDRVITVNVRRNTLNGFDQLALVLDNFVLPATTQPTIGGGWATSVPVWDDGIPRRDVASFTRVQAEALQVMPAGPVRSYYMPAVEARPLTSQMLSHLLIGLDCGVFWRLDGALELVLHPPAPLTATIGENTGHVLEIFADPEFDTEDNDADIATEMVYNFNMHDRERKFVNTARVRHDGAIVAYDVADSILAPSRDFLTINDAAIALQLAVRILTRLSRAERTVTLSRGFHTLPQEPGARISVTHPDGPDLGGYLDRPMQIRRVLADIDQMRIEIGLHDLTWVQRGHSDTHNDVTHGDGHGDTGHTDGHTDTHTDVHVDTHGDTPHIDNAHSDVAHNDGTFSTPHTDVAHVDTHGDSHSDTHGDTVVVGHNDTPHTDVTHIDNAHSDHNDYYHEDRAFVDINAHNDTHTDTAHADVAHGDYHDDSGPGQPHHDSGFHNDWAHSDVAHQDNHSDHNDHSDVSHYDFFDDDHFDTAHADSPFYDTPHSDYHGDDHVDTHADSHNDTHNDAAHSDVAHVDGHADAGHSDTAHIDANHNDGHSDTHTDTHVDAHGDLPHLDTAHTDAPHTDGHSDDPHGVS